MNIGAFSAVWGNNPDNDLAMPEIIRDKAKEDMIFERLDEWIWSLENDKPPTMADVHQSLLWSHWQGFMVQVRRDFQQ